MNDEGKTKEQLLQEVNLLRQELQELKEVSDLKGLETLLSMVPAGISAAQDPSGHDIWHNPMAAALLREQIRNVFSGISGPAEGILKNGDEEDGIVALIRDITERKQLEKNLRANEEKLRILFNKANDIIHLVEIDAEGQFTGFMDVNQEIYKKLGYTREEFLNMNLDTIVAPQNRRKLETVRKRVLAKGRYTFEIDYVTKSGLKVPMEVSSQAINLDNKTVMLSIARDITERKIAEQALLNSEARFRSAFDDAVVGMLLVGLDGGYLKVNRSFCRFLGYPEEEILRMSVNDTTYKDDLAMEFEYLIKLIKGEIASFQIEKRFIHESGRILWGLTGVSLIRNEKGQPLYFLRQVQDITQFKRASAELQYRVELEKLITAISTRFINLSVPEIDGEINQALKEIGNFIGSDSVYIFMFSDEGRQINLTYEWCADGIVPRKGRMNTDTVNTSGWWYQEVTKGENIYVPRVGDLDDDDSGIKLVFSGFGYKTVVNTPLVQNHKVTGFMGFASIRSEKVYSQEIISLLRVVGEIILNAIERKNAEISKQLSEDRFFKVFNTSPSAMAIISPDSERFLDVNQSLLTDLEYIREEVVGRTASQLRIWADSKDRLQFKNTFLQQGSVRNLEIKFRSKSGEVVVALVSAEQIYLDDHPCILVVSQNITDRQLLQEEMSRLERLNLVGEMAAGVSHEIRNPMTTVRGFLQMLGSKKENAQSKEFFDLMIEELDRANAIITEFLSLGRYKRVNLERKNLNDIVEAIHPLIYADAVNSDRSVRLSLGDVPDLVLDQKEIRQLILNLSRNGLEAMQEGGRLRIETFRDGEEVILAVKDEGPGIDPAILKKLGTPFFTTKPTGTGLGLAVCYSIVARHNAKLKIESSAAGTIVSVRFECSP